VASITAIIAAVNVRINSFSSQNCVLAVRKPAEGKRVFRKVKATELMDLAFAGFLSLIMNKIMAEWQVITCH